MLQIITLAMTAFLTAPALVWGAPCVDTTNGSLEIGSVSTLKLGRFSTPDVGSAAVDVNAATGSRTLAPELNINDTNRMQFGDVFAPAEITILGGIGCYFLITVSPIMHSIDSVNIAGAEVINAQGGGFLVSLGIDGQALIKIGASVSIRATTSSTDITDIGALEILVAYADGP